MTGAIIRALGILILFLFTPACQDAPPDTHSKKNLIVAVDATFIPMSFVNDRGQLDGFEVDLIQAVIREAGYDLKLVNVDWAGLFGGLITGKFDMLISSITILEERKKRMAFSTPYLQSGVALLVRKDMKIAHSLEDLNPSDGAVGAQLNTTSYLYLEKFKNVKKKGYEKFAHATLDLLSGKIIAVLGDTTQVNYFHKQNRELNTKTAIAGQRLTSENYGIVFRKDSQKIIADINGALKRLIASGAVQTFHDKWNLGEFATVPSPGSPG